MQFPNAYKGIKRIFTAEILMIISAVCAIIGIVMAIITAASASSEITAGTAVAGGSSIILVIAAGILILIAGIMKIVGIVNAGKDEESFKTALIVLLIGLVAGMIGTALASTSPVVSSILNIISEVLNLAVTIFIIMGIIKIADKLNNGAVSNKGNNLFKVIATVYILALIAEIIVMIMGGYAASIVAGIIAIVAYVLNIISYFMFLSLLSSAKKMLAE